KKQGYRCDREEEMSCKTCWNKSVRQIETMMNRIISLEPHSLIDTCSLNNARKLILEMAEPMVKLQATIKTNVAYIQSQEERIKHSEESIEDLARNMILEVEDLEMQPL